MSIGTNEPCPRCGALHPPDVACERVDPRIGTVLADRYTLVGLIGRGGMGSVYEARHAVLARRFAVKFLLPEYASNRDMLRRFENEAKAGGELEHPNLAAVTDVGRSADGSPFLVMEFLQGEDCARLLRRIGPLTLPRAADIIRQACRGLAVAHAAGIVHRDLKPENLFLTRAGDGTDLVKVLDFGIAKLRSTDAGIATRKGETMGTYFYMSPEHVRGAANVDQRTDVWALGVVLYELLSGRRPFEGEELPTLVHQILSTEPKPLGKIRPGLPAGLVSVVEKAMTKEPDRRLPTVGALGEALAKFAHGAPSRRPLAIPAEAATEAAPGIDGAPSGSPSLGESGVASKRAVPSQVGDPRRFRPRVLVAALGVVVAGLGSMTVLLARGGNSKSADTSAAVADGAAAIGFGFPGATLDARVPVPPATFPSPSAPTVVRTVSEEFEHSADAAAAVDAPAVPRWPTQKARPSALISQGRPIVPGPSAETAGSPPPAGALTIHPNPY